MNIEKVTSSTYECPKGEEHLFHVKMEVTQFDPRTGKKLSHPRIQKFGRKAFKSHLMKEFKNLGYTVEILHDPDDYADSHPAEQKASTRKVTLSPETLAEIKSSLREEILAEIETNGGAKSNKKGGKKKEEPTLEPAPEPGEGSGDPDPDPLG